jgi:oxygen-dependent protoporphyrinogen oxidase
MTINGNLWMSSVFSKRAPDNCVLLSSYIGGSRQPSAINFSTSESVEHVLRDISPLLGISASPVMGRVDKHVKALPLYHGNYHQNMIAIKQELHQLPGLHIEANYIGGVSVRDRIVSSKETASKIIAYCSLLNEKSQKPNNKRINTDFNQSFIHTTA